MQHHRIPSRSQTKRFFLFIIALPVLATAVVGCSDPAPVKAPPTGVVTKQTLSSAPTSTIVQQVAAVDDYTYNPGTRRDPFAPIMEREGKKTKSGERPPLERYSISEFKLSGIVWGGFGYSAMLEGPDGKGYFVRNGTILGPNRGIVKKITQNMMFIEETYKTYTGETERKEIILEFRKKQEETP
jgi:type IV pilus assembly protein PilP